MFKFGIYCKRREVRQLLRSEREREAEEEKKGKEKIMGGLEGKNAFSLIINAARRLHSLKQVIGEKKKSEMKMV